MLLMSHFILDVILYWLVSSYQCFKESLCLRNVDNHLPVNMT